MGIQHLLAKMTAQCPGFDIGTGGVPTITADDVRTGLGMIQYRQKIARGSLRKNEESIPTDNTTPLAILLIEARYLDDERSKRAAAWTWAKRLYCAWWDHDAELTETISKAQMSRLAYVMVADYCVPEKARIAGDAALAKAAGMDFRVWKRKYARFYGQHMRQLWEIESPVIADLVKVLFPRKSADC